MKLSDVVSHAGLSLYAEIALVIFAVVFLLVVVYLARRGSELEAHAALPLADDVAQPMPSEQS